MASVPLYCKLVQYADDTTLYFSAKSINQLRAVMQLDLNRICNWLEANCLQVNGKKSQFMIVAPDVDDLPTFSIRVGTDEVKPAAMMETLGFKIDNRLSFDQQIDHMRSKGRQGLFALGQAAKCVDRKTLVQMANGVVMSHLHYGDITVGQAAPTTLARLQPVQNMAIRTIFGLDPMANVDHHRRRLGWVPVQQKHEIHLSTMIWKALHQQAPVPIQQLFVVNPVVDRPYNFRQQEYLFVPTFTTERGQRSLSYRGPTLYNSLPSKAHEADTPKLCREITYSHFYNQVAPIR
jgi:hypothetical protein